MARHIARPAIASPRLARRDLISRIDLIAPTSAMLADTAIPSQIHPYPPNPAAAHPATMSDANERRQRPSGERGDLETFVVGGHPLGSFTCSGSGTRLNTRQSTRS